MKAIKHVMLNFFLWDWVWFSDNSTLFIFGKPPAEGVSRSFPTDFRWHWDYQFFTVDLCLTRDKLISFIQCLGKYLIHLIGLIEIKTEKRPLHYGYLVRQITSINCKNLSLIFFKTY